MKILLSRLFCLLLFPGIQSFSWAGTFPVLPPEQIVQQSRYILTGVVESQETHWNTQHSFIFTTYTLKTEQIIKGDPPAQVQITVPGGALEGQIHASSAGIHLQPQQRYLLCINALNQANPFVGGPQGVYAEILPDSGRSARSGNEAPSAAFEQFVNAVRDFVQAVKSHPPAISAPPGGKGLLELTPEINGATQQEPHSLRELIQENERQARYVLSDLASPPVAPISWNTPGSAYWTASSFSATPDLDMMNEWNRYASGLLKITSSSGSFGWENNTFDIAGFVSNESRLNVYGSAWSGESGITFTRWFTGGPIIEADILLNPDSGWDDASVRATLLHEIGHAFGLDHPWESGNVTWNSVMNYGQHADYDGPRLYADDSAAVRAAYPQLAVSLYDATLSAYSTQDGSNYICGAYADNCPEYLLAKPSPSSLNAGSNLSLDNPITVENTGTQSISGGKIEVYLTPMRFSWENKILLSSLNGPTLDTHAINRIYVSNLTVPTNTPSGLYYVALLYRDSADQLSGNNGAWTWSKVQVNSTVSPTAYTLNLTVSGSGQVTDNQNQINCGSDCQGSYNSGTAVTLTATPASGATFSGWGGDCSGTQSTCQLNMNAAHNASATFSSSGGSSDLVWNTSKSTAMSLALQQGKRVILVAGRDSCGNTQYMRNTLFQDPAIKDLIQQGFVLWYSDIDNSTEWYPYSSGLGSFTLPLIAVIDPANSNAYLDRSTNIQTLADTQTRLQTWMNVTPPVESTDHLVNISSRAYISGGANDILAGFVINGNTPLRVMLRGIAVAVGVNPTITLSKRNGTVWETVTTNDEWEGHANAASVKALPAHLQLPDKYGNDAGMLLDLSPGIYSVQLSSSGSPGLAVVGVDAVTDSGPILINISSRAYISGGANDILAGFVISGNSTLPVMLRGIAVAEGVNPTITLSKRNGTVWETVIANDEWESHANAASVKALPAYLQLPDKYGNDAGMLLNLSPGVYSVQLSSGGSPGLAVVGVDAVQN